MPDAVVAQRAIDERPLAKLSEDELTSLSVLGEHATLFAEGIDDKLSVLGELAGHELAVREHAGPGKHWSK